MPVSDWIATGSRSPGFTNVSSPPSGSSARMRTAPSLQIRDRTGEPRGLEVDDDVGRLLEQQIRAGRRRERDAPARQARRASPPTTSSSSSRARPAGAEARAKSLRRLLGRHRRPVLLHELDEAVGRVERQLHGRPA